MHICASCKLIFLFKTTRLHNLVISKCYVVYNCSTEFLLLQRDFDVEFSACSVSTLRNAVEKSGVIVFGKSLCVYITVYAFVCLTVSATPYTVQSSRAAITRLIT